MAHHGAQDSARASALPARRIIIDVQADAFLHQMMRLLVANLVKIGSGEQPVSWMEELLHARNRDLAGKVRSPSWVYF